MRKKMLITCSAMIPDKYLKQVREMFDVTEGACALSEKGLKELIRGMDVVVIGGDEFYDLEVLQEAKPTIVFIFVGEQGDTSFSKEALAIQGGADKILLTGGGVNEVARTTVAEISDQHLRKVLFTSSRARNFLWTPADDIATELRPLSELEVSVIGAGAIGCKVLSMLEGKTRRLKYYARSQKIISKTILWEPDLVKAFDADIVTVHLRLTQETEGIITEKHFSRIRKRGLLIDNARFGLFDERDFLAYVTNGGEVISDVYPLEGSLFENLTKDKENPLAQIINLHNFIFTSHTASFSEETFEEYGRGLMRVIAENKLAE